MLYKLMIDRRGESAFLIKKSFCTSPCGLDIAVGLPLRAHTKSGHILEPQCLHLPLFLPYNHGYERAAAVGALTAFPLANFSSHFVMSSGDTRRLDRSMYPGEQRGNAAIMSQHDTRLRSAQVNVTRTTQLRNFS